MAKKKFQIDPDQIMDNKETEEKAAEQVTEQSAKEQSKDAKETERTEAYNISLANLRTRSKTGRSEVKYMSLNIYGYEDYLKRMAKYKTEQESKRIREQNKAIRKDDTLTDEEKKSMMQRANAITRTKYILDLIQADMEKNKEIYDLLKGLNAYD